MLKKTYSAISLLVMSFGSTATTYEVDVNLVVERTPIQIQQDTAMSFPELLVNEASENGDKCTARQTPLPNTSTYSLCNDANVGGQEAQFTISGTPGAVVTYTRSAPVQTQDGLEFSLSEFTNNRTLDANGQLTYAFDATITLVDKDVAVNAPGTKTFTYDFVAAYQ